MRKFLKWFVLGIGTLLFIILIAAWIIHEPKPTGTPSPEADALARRMMTAIHQEAWDATALVQWTFAGSHHYLWDKQRNWVRVLWGKNTVLLDTKTSRGVTYEDETVVMGEEAETLLQTAEDFFNNDSFWLNAPAKAFDPGTERSLVTLNDGRSGLMVSYQSGGTTPRDTYVWLLDEQGLPTSWKLWVSIIPIGGVEVSWEGWTALETGARVSTRHRGGPLTLVISDLRGASTWSELDEPSDPFAALAQQKKGDESPS